MSDKLTKTVLSALTLLFIPAYVWAADHREAPLTQEDPAADINDIYLFSSPENASTLVVAMTINPFSIPAEAPTYNFSPNVEYSFKFDLDGDARPDKSVSAFFDKAGPDGQLFWLVSQSGRVLLSGIATPPSLGTEPIEPIVSEGSDGWKAFAGPRDDPFFFDVVGVVRFLNGTGAPSGTDGFAGFNTSAIVLEIPLSWLFDDSEDMALGMWATTARERVELRFSPRFTQVLRNGSRRIDEPRKFFGRFIQVERMGNPGVSTVLVPSGLKDLYNIGRPRNDANDFAPVLVESLSNLGTSEENINVLASVAVPDILNYDVNTAVGFPNGRGLTDDVIDTLLTLITNGTVTGDGVDANDKTFIDTFPYLAPPQQAP